MSTRSEHFPAATGMRRARCTARYKLTLLSGREEELLTATGTGSADAVTAVLASCVRRLGTISPVGEEVTSALLVGDRHYLMLHLRQAAFGDRVRAELVCPWPDCGRRVSLELSLSDVPVSGRRRGPPPYTMTLSPRRLPVVERARQAIAFRLPTGADQRELSAAAGRQRSTRTVGAAGPMRATYRPPSPGRGRIPLHRWRAPKSKRQWTIWRHTSRT